jgi:hypothetical protein
MIPAGSTGTLLIMKRFVFSLCLVFGAAGARADDKRFAFNQEEYVAGVHRYGVTDDTRIIGWQISDDLYFGRRQGEVDDFGFVFKHGATQYSFTQHGIGWRHAFTLH